MAENKNDLLASAQLVLNATKMLPVMKVQAPAKIRRSHKPSLVSVAKEASKAAIEVKQYEVRPDGTIVVVTGKPDIEANINPWLANLETKQ
jgi:hypothetical protein